MPAKITIQSGISAGSSHWLDSRVVRIGSDPTADVCLPSADVASHALTLEYRDGHYRIYNRSGCNVFMGTHVVAPDDVATWVDTDILQLGDEIQLVLDVGEDPAPTGQPRNRGGDDVASQEEPAISTRNSVSARHRNGSVPAAGVDVASKSSRFGIQLGVILACVVGSILLLARHQLQARPDAQPPPQFAEVIQTALASPTTSRELVARLQFAEAAVVRGDKQAAVERFERLRDDLLPQRESFVTDRRDPELAMLDYIEFRLSRWEGASW